jgi:hypothetical protein
VRKLLDFKVASRWLAGGLQTWPGRLAPVTIAERAGLLALALVALGSAPAAAVDLARLVGLVQAQLAGRAQPLDFLNLYTGAALWLRTPAATYQPAAQLALQQQLTGGGVPLTPFYLPPYALPLIAWLALLPYAIAYLVWLAIGGLCMLGSAAWLAPRWGGRGAPLVWLGLALLYLPAFLGLAHGQTAALMLLGLCAVCCALLGRAPSTWPLVLGAIVWTLKPQLAPWLVVSLALQRQVRALVWLAVVLLALGLAATVRLGPQGLLDYGQLALQKGHETLVADPGFLPGPTLLHASQWFLGVGLLADGVAAVLVMLAVGAFASLWRGGPIADDALAARLAAVPIMAVISAPYALAHELTAWLASFWLLWPYTRSRPAARAALLWLAAMVWAAGDVAVVFPLQGGADIAALLGLVSLLGLAWMVRQDRRHRP